MPARMLISLLSCVFALAVVGCGSGDSGTIPPNDAETLLNLVTAVQGDISDGECERATQHAQELVTQVGQLPNEVDSDVAGELAKASTNLEKLANTQCTDTGASGATDAQTTSTSTTTTPDTTTEVPTTTSTTTNETTTTLPPEQQAPTQGQGQQPPTGQGQNQGGPPTPPSTGGGPASGGVTGGGNAG